MDGYIVYIVYKKREQVEARLALAVMLLLLFVEQEYIWCVVVSLVSSLVMVIEDELNKHCFENSTFFNYYLAYHYH